MAAVAALCAICFTLRSDTVSSRQSPSTRLLALPSETLWVWQRTEDLRNLDQKKMAIACLDQTIVIGAGVEGRPRFQPLAYPTGTTLVSVVRIEVRPGAQLDAEAQQKTVQLLLESAGRPGIAAFQVDFDATREQRSFYTDVLQQLRRRMSASLPLSMTALASWCSYDDWISNLPVDEVVPMFFRMEPDRRRARPDLSVFRIREPLCMHSVGISTREPWPQEMAGKRIYVFPDRGWREDFSLIQDRKLQ